MIYLDTDAPAKAEEPLTLALGYTLAALIGDISERCYCAGWLVGCEFDALEWAKDEEPTGPIPWGQGEVSVAEQRCLRAIRLLLDGAWVGWVDGGTYETCGVYLLTPEEWAAHRVVML